MGPTMYLYEKAREAHYHDLQREMAEKPAATGGKQDE